MLLASTYSMSSIITQGHSSCQVYIQQIFTFMPISEKMALLITLVKVLRIEHGTNTKGWSYINSQTG